MFLLCVCIPFSFAAEPLPVSSISYDQVIVNSWDWLDVYQGLYFAKLSGKPGDYVLIPELAQDVVQSMDKTKKKVLLIEPSRGKQYVGMEALLEKEGFSVVSVPGTGSFSFRLLSLLDPKQIIITDARYPYNAIALAPFGLQRQSFILFSDGSNTNDILAWVSSHAEKDITVYGVIDANLLASLTAYNPTIIDKGGKFDNNIFLVEEFFRKEGNMKQIVLTNGEFIEQSLIDDFNPILFIGRSAPPKQVEEYLGKSEITVAVVVGNYLGDSANTLKKSLKNKYDKDMTFILKFAKTPRVMTESFVTPTGLEYFALPIIAPGFSINSVAYNQLLKNLEVTYDNPSTIPTFFLSSFSVVVNGEIFAIGDEQPSMIPGGQQKTILYDIDLPTGSISIDAFSVYGDYPKSLEFSFSKSFTQVPVLQIADYAKLEITNLVYDKIDEAFYVSLHNPGDVPVYTNIELVEVIIDGLPTTLGTQKITRIEPGDTVEIYVRAKLSSLDMKENEEILLRAFYGQRESVLFKTVEKTFALKIRIVKEGYLFAAGAIIVLLLLLFLLWGRKKSFKCDRCGHVTRHRKNPRRHFCGGLFKKI